MIEQNQPALEPRTAAEFQRAGRWIERDCAACLAKSLVEPSLVVFTYGDDFDMRANVNELQRAFACPCCSAKYPDIRFVMRPLGEEPGAQDEPASEQDNRRSA